MAEISQSALVRLLSDLFAGLSDLMQKEMRLLRAEVSESVGIVAKAGAAMGVAGLLGIFALLFLLQAAVFGIAAAGLAMHWSCLIVAGVLLLVAAALFFYGRSQTARGLAPTRSTRQMSESVRQIKEQFQ